MCGRYALFTSPERLRALFALTRLPPPEEAADDLRPRYNIAPTQRIAIVRALAPSADEPRGGRELALVRWGLVPSWAADPQGADLPQMINARAETAASRPAFREAFAHRRCLVPADGFYEWKAAENAAGTRRRTPKTPMFVRPRGGSQRGVFALAGLWERWIPRGGGPADAVESCTILTVAPNPLLAAIHDRMPAIIAPEDYDRWLDPAAGAEDVQPLLGPYPAEHMEAYPVSRAVNTPAHDAPDCIEPASASPPRQTPPRPRAGGR
jgi:putative SOS response-associated peptidase YedK